MKKAKSIDSVFIILTLILMSTTSAGAQENIQATSEKKTFRLEYDVKALINADSSTIWKILTNGPDFPKWNSTVISLEGEIIENEKIKLKSTSDSSRTFTLKVSYLSPPKMVWKSGVAPMFKGVRTYLVAEKGNGTAEFRMTEVLSGLMLPIMSGALPDFKPVFEQFAMDLKKEAEKQTD